jgi:hypothetical protein
MDVVHDRQETSVCRIAPDTCRAGYEKTRFRSKYFALRILLARTMMADKTRQNAFRRMLAREAGTDADAQAIAAAFLRLCEHFARQLTPLIGDSGVAAIFARSLHLVQRQFPALAAIRASDQRHGTFAHAQQCLEHQQPALASESAVALLTTVGELLASFIGEGLTTRLLREAWPDDFAADTVEEITT